jgi:DNA-binding transcriptional ArsR family regulator
VAHVDVLLNALAAPARRELLRRLAVRPCRAGELAEGFAMSRPAVVKHTRALTNAGLIKARKSGRERIYELAPKGGEAMRELITQLEQLGKFWDVTLEAFKQYAEEKE